MRKIILLILIATFLLVTAACEDEVAVSYSYVPNGLQSVAYDAVLEGEKITVSYSILLTEISFSNTKEPDFIQTAKTGKISFEYKNVSQLKSSLSLLEAVRNQSASYDYVNEFKISTQKRQTIIRICDKNDIQDIPPYLTHASCLIELHKYILKEIGKELKVNWHCFYEDVF